MTNDEIFAIFDADFNEKFELATYMKIDINRPGRIMRHPLEDGSSVADHFIVDPIEIEVLLMFHGPDMQDQYQAAVQAFQSGELLIVQARSGSYPNMVIDGMPHDETSDMVDALAISLRMIEAKFVEIEYTPAPAKASNKKTVKRGEQTAKPKQSVAYGLFH